MSNKRDVVKAASGLSNRWVVRLRKVWCPILLICVSAAASAQQSGRYSDSDSSSTIFSTAPMSGLAQRISDILTADPDLMTMAKKLIATRAEDAGMELPPGELSNAAVLRQIRENPDFRDAIAAELERRGYLDMRDDVGEGSGAHDDEMPDDRGNTTGMQRQLDDRGNAVGMQRQLDDRGNARGMQRQLDDRGNATGIQRQSRNRTELGMATTQGDRGAGRANPRETTVKRESMSDGYYPDVVRKASPYSNLPALRGLYEQLPVRNARLSRFGSDVFKAGIGNQDRLPMDMPLDSTYIVGPGDSLTIDISGTVPRHLLRDVDREGRVSLPEVGPVFVAGKNLSDVQQTMQTALRREFREARVDVSVSRIRTVRVYVVGDVLHPGPYDISALSTVLNALYEAGGPTSHGSMRVAKHYRGSQLLREVDLYDLILRGQRGDAIRLEPGDTVLIPPAEAQVTVDGMVRRPAVYELHGEATLADMLDLSGGVLVTGALRQITVERIEAHSRRTTIGVNIPDDASETSIETALRGFKVQDGDRIFVAPILPYSDQAVYLDGHVYRPGKYSYRSGMTVHDLVRSYAEMLPEPADRAEIVRLALPLFKPVVIPFSLLKVLSGGPDVLKLQPFDTVRIYGRYEYDAPRVTIAGEVLKPGEYPLSQGMRVSDLIRMAGGFTRGALTETADLSTYDLEVGKAVTGTHREILLAAALQEDPDPEQDPLLKAGDILSIRQLSGWDQIGASIVLSGEVVHPGTYGIMAGERLSSVIRRAGGFRLDAYTAGAVLERVQVRRLAEQSKQELLRRLQSSDTASIVGKQNDSATMQAVMQQRNENVNRLRNTPTSGRQVIRITSKISEWENTDADIELREGDTLVTPKRPNFVIVQGQVNSPVAQTYTLGKNAEWYLRRAGGPTAMGNTHQVFIVRADGSVIGERSGKGKIWRGGVLSTTMHPGDTIVVPDKPIGRSQFWSTLVQAAQITSSVAIAASVAGGL